MVFPLRFKISEQDDFSQFEKAGSYNSWLQNKQLQFLITCSNEEAEIINKVYNQPATLDDFVLVKRGIEVYNPIPECDGLRNPQPAFTGILQRYRLEQGPTGFISYPDEIQKSKPIQFFSSDRILLRQVLSRKLRLQAVFTSDLFLTNQSVQSLVVKENRLAPSALRFFLGLLNSRLLSWFFQNINSVARRDDFPKIIIQQTREMPIPGIDLSDSGQNKRHEQMVHLVDQMPLLLYSL